MIIPSLSYGSSARTFILNRETCRQLQYLHLHTRVTTTHADVQIVHWGLQVSEQQYKGIPNDWWARRYPVNERYNCFRPEKDSESGRSGRKGGGSLESQGMDGKVLVIAPSPVPPCLPLPVLPCVKPPLDRIPYFKRPLCPPPPRSVVAPCNDAANPEYLVGYQQAFRYGAWVKSVD